MLRVTGDVIERISYGGDNGPDDTPEEAGNRFSGAYALPGLIDMHVHYPTKWDRELCSLLYLMHGVTGVREMGNLDGSIWETRRMIRNGDFPGPRIFTGGKIVDGSPPSWPGSLVVQDAAEAEAAVERLASLGADFVKVYSGLSPETLLAIREAAAERSLPVVGHIPFNAPLEEAGVEDVQHMLGVWPKYYWNHWGELDQDRIDRVVQISMEQGIAHTPTLVMWDRLAGINDLDQQGSATARLMPRYYRRLVWDTETGLHNIRNIPAREFSELAKTIPTMKEVVRRLHRAGVRIHAGTDTIQPYVVPGASLHEELYHLMEAGMTTEDVWIAATRASGESLGEPTLGLIEEGAPADLLIFREDPTSDLTALWTLEAVIAQGRLYTKEELDRAFARHKKHFEGHFYDSVSMAICRFLLTRGARSRH
jgi:cytosine/adenosine deaminase-related metal-dependent hydrolase